MASSDPIQPRSCLWPPDSAAMPPSSWAKAPSSALNSPAPVTLSPPQTPVQVPERPKLPTASLDLDAGSPRPGPAINGEAKEMENESVWKRGGSDGVSIVSANAKKDSKVIQEQPDV